MLINTQRKVHSSRLEFTMWLAQGQILQNNGFPCSGATVAFKRNTIMTGTAIHACMEVEFMVKMGCALRRRSRATWHPNSS